MNVCNCGTVEETVRAAEKLYAVIAATDCPVWAFQVATALRTISIEMLLDGDTKRRAMAEVANIISDETRKTMRQKDVLETEVNEERGRVHG